MNLSKLVEFFFPKFCLICGQHSRFYCERCFNKSVDVQSKLSCHVCGIESRIGFIHKDCEEFTYLDGLVNLVKYSTKVKNIIWEGKYKDSYRVFDEMSEYMADYLLNYKFLKTTLLTSVPLNSKKKRSRGFNQAELLAKRVSQRGKIPYANMLFRSKNTKTQVGMSKDERLVNLKNAFEIDLKYKNHIKRFNSVTIIDDVFTTGTTLAECAKQLKQVGVEKVYGMVFAKR